MARSVSRWMLCAALVSLAALQGLAGEGRRHATAVERYGLGGHVQPIGLHHGFHVTSVQPGSPAEQDRLRPHDVIVKVDGELIRSLEHLQTLLTDAYEDDGKVTLTVLKAGSLEHHVLNGNVRGRDESRTARSTDDTRR